jgi:hypothetical protein
VKLLLVAVFVAILGFLAGVQLEKMRHTQQDIEQLLRSEQSEQRYATILGLAVLDALEAGQLDKAKSLLARELTVYHHAFQKREVALAEEQRLAPQIDALAAKSTALKQELQKPSK